MLVAGGCYIETCESPRFRGLYGSGGRAAAALSSVTSVQLLTYYPPERRAELGHLEQLGVEVRSANSGSALSFAYFHPLSDPVMAPPLSEIAKGSSLTGQAECVLRFGLLEGDSVVAGVRVVYDPQTTKGFAPFANNGSSADELALVLNADEVRSQAGESDVEAAAREVSRREEAAVLVVKAGPRGALILEAGEIKGWAPAYRSERVFKIGTGDIFSAAFAYWWGERRLDPLEAADRASRSVALYAAQARPWLVPEAGLQDLAAAPTPGRRPVQVYGAAETLGERWLIHEAHWRLAELGVEASAPELELGVARPVPDPVRLVIADGMDEARLAQLTKGGSSGVVVLAASREAQALGVAGRVTSDFATAIYWAAWASGEAQSGL